MDVKGFEPLTPCLQTGGRVTVVKSKSLLGLRLTHSPPEPTLLTAPKLFQVYGSSS